MANVLIEKRKEYVEKLSILEAERTAKINEKVEEYRASLEATISKDEIVKTQSVICALDEVINYDESLRTNVVETEIKAETEKVETVEASSQVNQSRPGMVSVCTPVRG